MDEYRKPINNYSSGELYNIFLENGHIEPTAHFIDRLKARYGIVCLEYFLSIWKKTCRKVRSKKETLRNGYKISVSGYSFVFGYDEKKRIACITVY